MAIRAAVFTLIVVVGLSMGRSAFGGEPPLSIAEIAEIFGYPADKLKVTDQTEEVNRRSLAKGRPQVTSVHRFFGADNTFAPLTICLAGEGLLLTDELRRYVEKTINESRAAGTKTFLTRLKFGDIGTGVNGLGMGGPGGSGEWAIISMPKQKTDVVISILIPGDPQLSVLPGAEEYFELVTGAGVRQRLVVCLNKIASKAAGGRVEAVEVK
jgi:hypothetical protein